ncbi:MAG: hypothetical protein KDD12_12600, partial [Lewinella sp.]|nr:hypothetical protein [Lewinella sp.]
AAKALLPSFLSPPAEVTTKARPKHLIGAPRERLIHRKMLRSAEIGIRQTCRLNHIPPKPNPNKPQQTTINHNKPQQTTINHNTPSHNLLQPPKNQ